MTTSISSKVKNQKEIYWKKSLKNSKEQKQKNHISPIALKTDGRTNIQSELLSSLATKKNRGYVQNYIKIKSKSDGNFSNFVNGISFLCALILYK